MKKITLCLMTTALLLCVQPLQSYSATKDVQPTTVVAPNPADAEAAKTLLLRLNEIKEMDKSKLTSSEKKSLRKEVRAIKTELQATEARGGGVYLSVGAIIIIILLLVILF
ncbi:MAG: hypothetical protein NTZ33_07015 [Bacteroidetes bacterium]|nr:hypothetical protein [Bacteroidota bacterium]